MKRVLEEEDSNEEIESNADSGDEISSATKAPSKTDAAPRKKKRQKSKIKDTSHDFSSREIARLQESEAVFHSSLFRLQVSEMLKEASVKQKLKQRIQGAIDIVTKVIGSIPAAEQLPSGEEQRITDRAWLEATGIKVPVLEKPFATQGTFQFLPPSAVKVMGSFSHNTIVKPDVEANLGLQIPKNFFTKKDYVNHRCIRKQALYLAYIATHLRRKKKQIESLMYSYYEGNPLKPILVLMVKGKDSKTVKVKLHTLLESDTFKISRFSMTQNNVRPNWWNGAGQDETDESKLPATPFCNTSIAFDLSFAANDEFVGQQLSGSHELCQGVMLLKIWLRQRQLLEGFGSFSGDLMSSYVVSLLLKKKVNKQMNSHEVFRTTLFNLSQADWSQDPPSLTTDIDSAMMKAFADTFPCVFMDRTGCVNLAYMMSLCLFKRVKEEARLSISALDQSHRRSFDVLFMTPMSFSRTFDYIFHVHITPTLLRSVCNKVDSLTLSSMDLAGQQTLAVMKHVEDLLSKALENRATLVQAQPLIPTEWEVTDEPHVYDDEAQISFGIRLNPAGALSVLSKGPVADAPEAKEFRDFWGDKSEMRRFKDGTIHEAVLWSESTFQSERRLVSKKIIEFILNRHCGIKQASIHYIGSQFDGLLHDRSVSDRDKDGKQGTGEEQSLAVIHAYDDVSKAVRSLTALPLTIHSVQGTHPVFRHSDVFPAIPFSSATNATRHKFQNVLVPPRDGSLPPYVPALTIVCMLEGSGKWPEDQTAIHCLKTLLHIKMASELKSKHLLSVCAAPDHVDVLMNGFVFRLVLANSREVAVLRTVTTDTGMVKFRDTEPAVALERRTVILPRHTHLLHGIQQEHPVFSAAVRLCKRWLASQMLWSLISDEAVELIVAHLFIAPHPYSPPMSPGTGLQRFLHLLSTFNWRCDPLMVNLNKEFTEEDLTTIPKDFSRDRASLPSMCIPTPQDRAGSKWTRPQPSEPLLQRIVLLARESLKILEAQVMAFMPFPRLKEDYKVVFRPPYKNFELIIRLLKNVNVLSHQAVDATKTVTSPPDATQKSARDQYEPLPVVEFDVCKKFLQDLKSVFGDYALFFYDPYGGDSIGMVWKQQALQKKDFKPSGFGYRKPLVNEDEKFSLEAKRKDILEDIKVMGRGIVDCIQTPL